MALPSAFAAHEQEIMGLGKRARRCIHYSEASGNASSSHNIHLNPAKSLCTDASPCEIDAVLAHQEADG